MSIAFADFHGGVLGLETEALFDCWEWSQGEALAEESVSDKLHARVVVPMLERIKTLVELLGLVSLFDTPLKRSHFLESRSEVLDATENEWEALVHDGLAEIEYARRTGERLHFLGVVGKVEIQLSSHGDEE